MNKICVIGLGRFGLELAERLAGNGMEVLAVDSDQELVDRVKDKVALPVRADATNVETLRSLGVDTMDMVIVAIGEDFQAAELALMAAQELKVPRIIARANDHLKKRILERLNADLVIMPEEEAAIRLAQRLTMSKAIESLELDKDHSIVHLVAPVKTVGVAMAKLDLRKRYSINLVAIKRRTSHTMMITKEALASSANSSIESEGRVMIPGGDTEIHSNDVLIIVGKDENIERFMRDHE